MKLKTFLCTGLVVAVLGVSQAMALQVTMQTFTSGTSGEYRADPSADLAWVLGSYVNGKTTDGTWFGTFCVETTEFFSPGSIYNVTLSDRAVRGSTGNTPGYDIISVGTAFLYSQFVTGNLSGFTYGNNASADALQHMIWWLEGEESYSSLADPFKSVLLSQFGVAGDTWSTASFQTRIEGDYAGTAVRVMNLTDDAGVLHQDQLVYVPDGGATLMLLGVSLLGIAAFRRRFSRR